MMFTAVYAQALVSDLAAAERWYAELFAGPPDRRPMDGLLTWLLGDGRGVQLWHDEKRAGQSSLTLAVDDLDGLVARLTSAGIEHGGAQPGGGARLVVLEDPDGNQVVVTGT